MKLKIVLFANLICLPLMAQRDYSLIERRNAWLMSGNAAALTTFADSSVARASLRYRYEGGKLRSVSEGKNVNYFDADVRSYYRLSKSVVAYGRMAYDNFNGSKMAGSMFMPTTELMPFDLIGYSEDVAGDKHAETFNVTGAVGWKVCRSLSIGARADYTAGTYAKHRDLRHTNTLMDLDTKINALLSFDCNGVVGAGFVYRRRTETMLFDVYGTTDRIYSTLVDYANHQGEIETFGVEGFTDGSNEQPLLSEYVGFNAQGKWKGLFADVAYLHRTGYYGKRSQYTASHERHRGDATSVHLRYDLPHVASHLVWIDANVSTERLTAERENYRRMTSGNGGAATYYEYYEPTKMSDKTQTQGSLSVNVYWKPAGEIFLWHINGGVNYWTRHQTAYVYPDIFTEKPHVLMPFVEAKRGLLNSKSSLLSLQAGCAVLTGSVEQIAAHAKVAYEMPIRGTRVRPEVSLRYDLRNAMGGDMKGWSRNLLTLCAAATF